jgi:hypothetical protein
MKKSIKFNNLCRFTVLINLALLLQGCSPVRYSPEIEEVLQYAGKNRGQLKKVLKYYSRNPADSLKLRAAEFLTVNMPGKYSVEYNAPYENVITVHMRRNTTNKGAFEKAYGLGEPVIMEDLKFITAEYLISNIELSFQVWEEQPWGKNIPFDIFCEEILPYRVRNEPLENWREKALASFDDLNGSFKLQSGITAAQACAEVNSQLPKFMNVSHLPPMNYSGLMTTTKGTCVEQSTLAVFVMRALGIPVTQDCTPKWIGSNVGHTWNSVYDSVGRHVSFMGCEANPGMSHQGNSYLKSKVYRLTFAKHDNIKTADVNIPPGLRYQCMTDVTREYGKSACVEIPVKYPSADSTGYVYLAAIGENAWNITGWGETDNKTVRFEDVGKNILHLPVYYANGLQTPANYPFLMDEEGNLRIFEPDTGNYRQMTVSATFPSDNQCMTRMIKGVFEGANRSDFSDAVMLYKIPRIDGPFFHTAKSSKTGKYRYVRYVGAPGSYCNVAEIEFYSHTGKKLQGKPTGTSGTHGNSMTHDKVFDGDPLTYYDAPSPYEEAWTGLDLGEPQNIGRIRYLPRNDDNVIYENHTYELFYWQDKDWQLFERQVAGTHILHFRVPADAVFRLRNVTTGKSGRWFITDENGGQKWM